MGLAVMILGQSGSGKSASMRTLDPATFSLVNVARKPLPFRSMKRSLDTDDYSVITSNLVKAISNTIVIDDAQYLMANAFMRRAKEAGYQKFSDIGLDFWTLIQQVSSLPAEKIVYFLGHTEVDSFGNSKFKTIGKMLDDKITIEGMFTIVLRTHVQDGHYYFSTKNSGMDTVKSPIGMFDEDYIDNDLAMVDAAIRGYYGLNKEAQVENTIV
jgi:hypothetical protein